MKNQDAPQPYENMMRNQITSPDRSGYRNMLQVNNFVNDSSL